MVQSGTILNVVDNSGGRRVICIKVNNGNKSRYASVGDVITVSVRELRAKRRESSKVKKGDVLRALVVRSKIMKTGVFGECCSFFDNSVILLSAQNKLIGTRIFGGLPNVFRKSKHLRILSLSSGVHE